MNGRTDLLAYLGTAIATTIGLFTLQAICVSYIDVSVVHASLATASQDPTIAGKRAQEAQKLSSGAMPLERAKEALAQRGRAVSNKIAPAQSTDLSAMSGWIHQPAFAPYVPKAAPVAAPVEASASDEAAPEEVAPAGGAEPADAAAAQGEVEQ
jgi:hypothetical protein